MRGRESGVTCQRAHTIEGERVQATAAQLCVSQREIDRACVYICIAYVQGEILYNIQTLISAKYSTSTLSEKINYSYTVYCDGVQGKKAVLPSIGRFKITTWQEDCAKFQRKVGVELLCYKKNIEESDLEYIL